MNAANVQTGLTNAVASLLQSGDLAALDAPRLVRDLAAVCSGADVEATQRAVDVADNNAISESLRFTRPRYK